MTPLEYTKIKNREQYNEYCKILNDLLEEEGEEHYLSGRVELLTLLIETYQNETSIFIPIEASPFTHILKTIELIRESFLGSEIAYTQGSCIKFAMILQHLYPSGKILYNSSHAIFEYYNEYFDIMGYAKKDNHIPIEEYGIIKMYELMNLKYNFLEISRTP